MPDMSLILNGNTIAIKLPEPGSQDVRSVFLIGLPKAGSTLLNHIMNPLLKKAGLTSFALYNVIRQMGLEVDRIPPEVTSIFVPKGYAYIGFRGWSDKFPIPACASGRTIFMVRDPRDMAVSQYFSEAYSHRPPGASADDGLLRQFEARRQEVRAQQIDDYVLALAPTIRVIHDRTLAELDKIDYQLWRYEDIVFDKLAWVNEMLAYLDLKVPSELIENVVRKQDIRPEAEAHDQHVRRVTPGDHRSKLKPDTIAALNEEFSDILAHYKYDAG